MNVPVSDGCDATGPLLALRNPNIGLDGFVYVPSATVSAGAIVTVPGPWQPPGTFTVALTGFDGATYSEVAATVVADGRRVGSVSASSSTSTMTAGRARR